MTAKRFIFVICTASFLLGGCQSKDVMMKLYDADSQQSEFSYFQPADLSLAEPFASGLCVVSQDVIPPSLEITAESASIYCIDSKEILYAKNVHQRMNPASLTKVMTAILLLESGKLNDMVTVTEEAMVTESGATLCDLKPGDQILLEDLLKCALIRSGNDAAAAIAVHLGGSVQGFADMMNQKAKTLGATNTNFTNPHGLTDENHYTTAYDMYLIMQEAMKYNEFLSVIQMEEFEYHYTNAEGTAKTNSYQSTNRYINGRENAPEGVTVIGGKTGTTNAAGSCLALLSRDRAGKWYCSIVLKADGSDVLFAEMTQLLAMGK